MLEAASSALLVTPPPSEAPRPRRRLRTYPEAAAFDRIADQLPRLRDRLRRDDLEGLTALLAADPALLQLAALAVERASDCPDFAVPAGQLTTLRRAVARARLGPLPPAPSPHQPRGALSVS